MKGAKPKLIDVVSRVLNASGWSPQRIPNEPAVRTAYQGCCGTWDVIAYADEEKNAVSFICPQLFSVDNDGADILDFVNQVNANLLLGKVIFLPDQHTVSAVLTVPCEAGRMSRRLILRSIATLGAIIDFVTPYMSAAGGAVEAGTKPSDAPILAARPDPSSAN